VRPGRRRDPGQERKAEPVEKQSRILVMSDDAVAAQWRCAQLALHGWAVFQATDHMDALSAVSRHDVDIVVLHLDPDETLATDLPNVLRQVAQTVYLPVILLAGELDEPQRCRCLDSGVDEIVGFEISAAELSSHIRAMLRIKDLQDALSASRGELQRALRRERKLLSKLREDNACLQALATTDPLTHAQNVRSFHDILEHEFKIARRYAQPLSLLMLDVDHFKLVNDNFGHPSGDYVLKELAVVINQSVRESDVLARIGGEEFAVVLPKADADQAEAFAERIRRQIAEHVFGVYGKEISVTISIGSASYPCDAEITEPEMLTYFADQALLMAKEAGRNCVIAVRQVSMEVRRRLRRQYLSAPLEAEKLLSNRSIPVTTDDQPAPAPVR